MSKVSWLLVALRGHKMFLVGNQLKDWSCHRRGIYGKKCQMSFDNSWEPKHFQMSMQNALMRASYNVILGTCLATFVFTSRPVIELVPS